MNTVKHLSNLSLQSFSKRRFNFLSKNIIIPVILVTLLGNLLNFLFVTMEFYKYPFRPLSDTFSINILSSFIGLPLLVYLFLLTESQVNKWGRIGIILFLSLLVAIFEKFAEVCGVFVHSVHWNHLYIFIEYFLLLLMSSAINYWLEKYRG
ncbi:CBO0543 family protein [Bacillus sp. SORGH_AS_0510]|uniref:CBO0543 family protein n=1 Tax=Bacillus sp. SORGH_AS_0510 TaxID=3041771 RepID=UPI00359489F8